MSSLHSASVWDQWLAASGKSGDYENGLLKEGVQLGHTEVNSVINVFKKIVTENTPEITNPAAVYVAGYIDHPFSSLVNALTVYFTEGDLKETKQVLRAAKIQIECPNGRQKAEAHKANAEDIIRAIETIKNGDKPDAYRFLVDTSNLHKLPKFSPDELANKEDTVRRVNIIEADLKQLLTNHAQLQAQVATNTAKLNTPPPPPPKMPPHPNRQGGGAPPWAQPAASSTSQVGGSTSNVPMDTTNHLLSAPLSKKQQQAVAKAAASSLKVPLSNRFKPLKNINSPGWNTYQQS